VEEKFDRALSSGCPIINIFGPSGRGKSTLLQMLKYKMRRSSQFVDCLFPPLDQPDEIKIERIISRRLGGHLKDHLNAQDTCPAWNMFEQYHRAGRRTVFMIDDLHKLPPTTAGFVLDLLAQYDGSITCATTRISMKIDFGTIASRIECIELPSFDSNEIEKYFVANAPMLSDDRLKNLKTAMDEQEVGSHPILLRKICARLRREPEPDTNELIKHAVARLCEDVRVELESVFETLYFKSSLLYELTAPQWLDPRRVLNLLRLYGGDSNEIECQHLLENLLTSGILKRFDGRYWWEGQYLDCIQKGKLPALTTWRRLQNMTANKISNVSEFIESFNYLRQSAYGAKPVEDRTLEAVECLARNLPITASLPEDPLLEEALDLVDNRPSSLARRVAAQYYEARGNYDVALKICNRWETETHEAGTLPQKFQCLEKMGKFNDVAGIIVDLASTQGLPAEPVVDWGETLLFYWGRFHQTAGSLGLALEAYSLIDNLDDPDPVLQIHALIESSTVFVFGEEPELALAQANRALKLSRAGGYFPREEADALRYLARATKLSAVKGPAGERRERMEQAKQYASDGCTLAKSIGYMEGQLWSAVLEGRLAYFERDLKCARMAFERASGLARDHGYHGAKPHIDRHYALLMAQMGDIESAISLLNEAMSSSMRSERGYMKGLILHTKAKVYQLAGRSQFVSRLLKHTETAYRKAGLFDPPFSQLKRELSGADSDRALLKGDGIPW
jgi:tetratricopeptide (TPR) repeat protein